MLRLYRGMFVSVIDLLTYLSFIGLLSASGLTFALRKKYDEIELHLIADLIVVILVTNWIVITNIVDYKYRGPGLTEITVLGVIALIAIFSIEIFLHKRSKNQ